MPLIKEEVVGRMLSFFDENTLAVVVDLKGKLQTLHAFYRKDLLPHLRREMKFGKSSIWRVLRSLNDVKILRETDFQGIRNWYMSFFNINRKEDLTILNRFREGVI